MTPLSVVRRAGSFLPLSLALAILLLPAPARAQAVKGTLLGTVTDTTGAGVPGYIGFAIGRTIWWDPLKAFVDGESSREDAAAKIAANYRRMIDVYQQASAS